MRRAGNVLKEALMSSGIWRVSGVRSFYWRRIPKTMHSIGPLQADHGAFGDRQEPERGEDNERQPDCELQPQDRVKQLLNGQRHRNQNVADNKYG